MYIEKIILITLCVFTYILSTKFLSFFLKRKSIFTYDIPNKRSSHSVITPSSGGILFVISGFLISIFSGNLIPIACTPLAIIGYIDDRYRVKSSIRYLFHLCTCSLILLINNRYSFDNATNILITISLIFFGTALINLLNFMDGIDGLVISSMIFILLPFAAVESNNFFILIFSLLAFLKFNWHPAKIFMGDIGSTYLAAILFGFLTSFQSIENTFLNLTISIPLLFDSIICLIRRFFAGENIFLPHQKHIYQRLYKSGLKHSQITIIYILPTISLTILFFLRNYFLISANIIFVFIAGYYFEKFVCLKFNENK